MPSDLRPQLALGLRHDMDLFTFGGGVYKLAVLIVWSYIAKLLGKVRLRETLDKEHLPLSLALRSIKHLLGKADV
jgi:hypothetical protein